MRRLSIFYTIYFTALTNLNQTHHDMSIAQLDEEEESLVEFSSSSGGQQVAAVITDRQAK